MRPQERRRQKKKVANPSEDAPSTNSDKEMIVESPKGQKSAKKTAEVFTEKLSEQTLDETVYLLFKLTSVNTPMKLKRGFANTKE